MEGCGPPAGVSYTLGPRWVIGTSDGHGHGTGDRTLPGHAHNGPCPWTRGGGDGGGGVVGPWHARAHGRGPFPWAAGHLTAWWC